MPHFVSNGPDIPDGLLQAHEDGQVVFFCGAGIGVPAGLPLFRGLVNRIYMELGSQPSPIERAVLETRQYDVTLNLLERRYPGNREAVRRVLPKILSPTSPDDARAAHEALLQLSTVKGQVRLVTTNFDRTFANLAASCEPPVPIYSAPLLPIAKPARWHGIVYLHGLIPEVRQDDSALSRLVLTSGDFGLAYLTERWASRFVTDLFRYYTVCFVGYSIDDPVMRYMLDALAADVMLGQHANETFAFGNYKEGEKDHKREGWMAKGVTPVLYQAPTEEDHSSLSHTLEEWANTYRDGNRGREMIIVRQAAGPPSENTVNPVRWALTEPLGVKKFAELSPVPPFEWLQELRVQYEPLLRPGGALDEGAVHFARWLTRHLGDSRLVLWLGRHRGRMHSQLASIIRRRLRELDQLQSTERYQELDDIRASAPNAIPSIAMRSCWDLLLAGLVNRSSVENNDLDLLDWVNELKRRGFSQARRFELRHLLKPCVLLSERHAWLSEEATGTSTTDLVSDIFHVEVGLNSDAVLPSVKALSGQPVWNEVLVNLLPDFSALLLDVAALMTHTGLMKEKSDFSFVYQPSISENADNTHTQGWTELIDLTRDSWDATARAWPDKALAAAEEWRQTQIPMFIRLSFYAATRGEIVPASVALDWLLAEDAWWLWSVETRREAMLLLGALAAKLDEPSLARIEAAILAGPPSWMLSGESTETERSEKSDWWIWQRLTKLEQAAPRIGQLATVRLSELRRAYPQWLAMATEGEEGTSRTESTAPPKCNSRQLAEWLRDNPQSSGFEPDDWQARCRTTPRAAAFALCRLAQVRQMWPEDRWRDALQVWSDPALGERAWRLLSVLNRAPDEAVQKLDWSIAWFLQAVARALSHNREEFLLLCRRVLELYPADEAPPGNDAIANAINHPVGHITKALLRLCYQQPVPDGVGLPEDIKPLVTLLCHGTVRSYRHGRVILASELPFLYRVDCGWSAEHLLPLLRWNASREEASAVWQGFLAGATLDSPLMEKIKPQFLEAASRFDELDRAQERYVALLTFIALDGGDTFTVPDLQQAVGLLPASGLTLTAEVLCQGLGSAGVRRKEYWNNRVVPFLRSIWPQEVARRTPEIARGLGRVCVAAREAFPDAVERLRPWLLRDNQPGQLLFRLKEAELCVTFPEASLTFLDCVVGDDALSAVGNLVPCLDAIIRTCPALYQDSRYTRLDEIRQRATWNRT